MQSKNTQHICNLIRVLSLVNIREYTPRKNRRKSRVSQINLKKAETQQQIVTTTDFFSKNY